MGHKSKHNIHNEGGTLLKGIPKNLNSRATREHIKTNGLMQGGSFLPLGSGIVEGRAISIGDLKTALDKSYSKTKIKSGFGDFDVDSNLTTKETQVYNNPKTGQVLVVHRGTQGLRDVFTDIAYTATIYIRY